MSQSEIVSTPVAPEQGAWAVIRAASRLLTHTGQYEADSQLAWLATSGRVAAVVTEDSDLIVFGVPLVITKMNKFGQGKAVRCSDIPSVCENGFDFSGWDQERFRQMAILSGCDYLPSPVGIGLKKAAGLLARHGSAAGVFDALRLPSSPVQLPHGYEDAFRLAELTFLHQRVFDMDARRVVPLTPLPAGANADDFNFVGPPLPDAVGIALAEGRLDPNDLVALDRAIEVARGGGGAVAVAEAPPPSSSSNFVRPPEAPRQAVQKRPKPASWYQQPSLYRPSMSSSRTLYEKQRQRLGAQDTSTLHDPAQTTMLSFAKPLPKPKSAPTSKRYTAARPSGSPASPAKERRRSIVRKTAPHRPHGHHAKKKAKTERVVLSRYFPPAPAAKAKKGSPGGEGKRERRSSAPRPPAPRPGSTAAALSRLSEFSFR